MCVYIYIYTHIYIHTYIHTYTYTDPMKAANCFKPTTESGCYVRDGTVFQSFESDQIHIFIHNGMKDGRSEVRIYCKKYEMT